MGHTICSRFRSTHALAMGDTRKGLSRWQPGLRGAEWDTVLTGKQAGLGWGIPAMCLVLVKEKLAPQGSLLPLPLEHRPEGRTPLRGSLRTRSVCTRITTHWWVVKLGY